MVKADPSYGRAGCTSGLAGFSFFIVAWVAGIISWVGQWDDRHDRLAFGITVYAALAGLAIAIAYATQRRVLMLLGAAALLTASLTLLALVFFYSG
jgi:hypothetical protein